MAATDPSDRGAVRASDGDRSFSHPRDGLVATGAIDAPINPTRQLASRLAYIRALAYEHQAVLLLLPLLVILFLGDLGNLKSYHGDEMMWIPYSTTVFHKLFVEHDLSPQFWGDDFFSFGAYNPPIGKYVIGLGTYVAGYTYVPFIRYNWQHSELWNFENGLVLSPQIFAAARLPIAILGLLTCLLLYWLTTLVTNRWTAYIAVCVLISGQVFVTFSRRAMVDIPALFFALLALILLWFGIKTMRRSQDAYAMVWFAGCGVACGLAIGSKLSAGLVLLSCILALVVEVGVMLAKLMWPWRPLVYMLVISVCAAGTFISTNPFLYQDTTRGIAHMLSFAQIVRDSPSTEQTHTLDLKVAAVKDGLLLYAPLTQLRLPGDRWLLLAGCLGLCLSACMNLRDMWQRQLHIILVWVVVTLVGITLWLPNAWDRYTLPLQPCSAIVYAFGLVWLAQQAQRGWKMFQSFRLTIS